MKKTITFFKSLLLVVILLVGGGSVYGDTYSYSFPTSGAAAYTSNGTKSLGSISWTLNAVWNSGSFYGVSSDGQQIGSKDNPALSYSLTTSGITGTITSVKVYAKGYSTTPKIQITVGSTSNTQANLTTTSSLFQWNGSSIGNVVISVTGGTASTRALYIKSIEVTYTIAATPSATPTFSPAAGTYTSAQNVGLSSTTSGAKIYYTTNGADPSSSSTLYSSPINVSTSTTIKAIAYDSNDANPSSIATATYTINATSPTITVTGTLNAFANTVVNGTSAEQSYTLQGANLTGDVTVTPPAGFEISKLSGSGFVANPSTLTFTSGEITSAQNVYVRFAPIATQAYSGNITHTSTGATQVDKAVSGTAVNAEPTNQPTSFTATTNSTSQITVNWTDATGGQVPAGYLVKASTGTPTAPADGTAETAGTLVKIVAQGTQTAVFTGLDASTTYNFSIWPYTNSGAAIDYKTDGAIATSATTETPLGIPVATAATDVTPTGFTANWNAAASATGYELSVLKKDSEICNNPNEFFNETFGSNSANTDYSINNTFSTTSTNYIDSPENVSVNFSGDGRVGKNTTNPSTTYLGASGNSGAFRSNSSGTSTTVLLKISNIKIKDFQNIALSFGLYYTNGAIGSSSTVSVEYEIDGTGAKTFVFTQPSSTAVWTLCNGNINGSGSSLDLTFKLSTTGGYTARVDDIILKGCPVTPIPGSPFTVTETSKAVSGLNPGTEYFYTVVSKNASGSSAASNEISVTTPKITFTGTGEWTETARWNTGVVPGNTAQVVVDGDATINSNVEVAGLTINAGKSLTVNAAKQLTISGTATNNGTITIQSDANGTGTILGNVSGTATVNQYLPGYRTWYLSSPVASATPSGMDRIKYYDETIAKPSDNWVATTTMTKGKGYLVVPVSGNSILFTGTLNSGNVVVDLTRSVTNTDKPGFNLIGNPYPSYLDWTSVYANNNPLGSEIMPTSTMWYRTKVALETDPVTYEYKFWTVNGASGVGSPSTATKYIAPMQSFWVRAKNVGTSTLTFTNAMRKDAPAENKLLKAPAALNTGLQLLRLQVSNESANTDEAVIYFNTNASNGLDAYDSPKMSNENAAIPEIYTSVGNEQLVINGLNAIPLDQEIGLGFVAGNATSFSIKAKDVTNLPSDVKVILKDNVTKAETDLTDGTAVYSFNNIATSGDRFSIIFRTKGAVTGIDQPTFSGLTAYSNANNQLTVLYDGAIDAQTVVSVYNAVGQRLVTQSLKGVSTVIDGEFAPGVYVVKVNNLSRKLTIKK